MSGPHNAVADLRAAIAQFRPGEDQPPREFGDFWDDVLRLTLDGWASALERDLRRGDAALDLAAAADAAPSDDQVAALEERLWRLAATTEKVDAIVSLAFGDEPFVVVANNPKQMTMRPSRDRNKEALAG